MRRSNSLDYLVDKDKMLDLGAALVYAYLYRPRGKRIKAMLSRTGGALNGMMWRLNDLFMGAYDGPRFRWFDMFIMDNTGPAYSVMMNNYEKSFGFEVWLGKYHMVVSFAKPGCDLRVSDEDARESFERVLERLFSFTDETLPEDIRVLQVAEKLRILSQVMTGTFDFGAET